MPGRSLTKDSYNYFDLDNLHILAPTQDLTNNAIEKDDYNDSSYVLLFTPPKKNGGTWKILLSGDSHDATWNYILNDPQSKSLVSNVDILFAPHHGRNSNRSYEFLNTVNPKITLLGNASSEHLAYTSYPEIRITNNQAGYVILETSEDSIKIYVKNQEFANDFCNNPKRAWGNASFNPNFKAYFIGQINA